MEQLFLKNYVSDANPLTIKLKDGISLFETSTSIYVLANTKVSGSINEKLKKSIPKKICNLGKTIIYISMYEKKNDIAESVEYIAWGTYAWCVNEPNHYIHFDDKPSKLIIHKNQF